MPTSYVTRVAHRARGTLDVLDSTAAAVDSGDYVRLAHTLEAAEARSDELGLDFRVIEVRGGGGGGWTEGKCSGLVHGLSSRATREKEKTTKDED